MQLRTLLAVGVAACTLGIPAAAYAAPLSDFANPPADSRIRARWWLPNAKVDNTEVAAEVKTLADAGFGGAEMIAANTDTAVDPVEYGWGTPRWVSATETALQAAKDAGVKLDLTAGPVWPTGVPTINADSPASAKELAYGRAFVDGGSTFTGALPDPLKPLQASAAFPLFGGVTKQLIAVQAVRCVAADCSATTAAPVALDQASVTDLTATVQNGQITWTAPAGGRWIVFAYWQRGTGQVPRRIQPPGIAPSSPDAFMVDHFSQLGAQAVIDYWNSTQITPKARQLMHEVGGTFFEDSLELRTNLHWTPTMLADFQRLRGYSLLPYLAILTGGSAPDFEFAGTGPRVRTDYNQTLSDLYLANHITPPQNWAHGLGMSWRAQMYGAPIDPGAAAMTADVPEGEGADPNSFRTFAGGLNMTDRQVFSCECRATGTNGGAYGTLWSAQLSQFDRNFAGGVNQIVIHGYPYKNSPQSVWPGYSPFSPLVPASGIGNPGPGISEAWGPRMPSWTQVHDIADYVSRLQYVLRQGKALSDVAVFRNAYDRTTQLFTDPGLTRAGFTFAYVSPAVLADPKATVAGGRLAPSGPSYKALVVDNQTALPLATARTILQDAQAGLPVVIVGALASRTPGYRDAAAEDTAVQGVVAQLTALANVRRVAAEADVPAALAALAVGPAAKPAVASPHLTVHRSTGDVDLYYFYNPGPAMTDTTVALAGEGRPYKLDPWSGRVTPVALYGDGGVPLKLAADQTAVIAVSKSDLSGTATTAVHAVSSQADSARYDGGKLLVRSTSPGRVTTALSDGRTATTAIDDVPGPIALNQWHLSVSSWEPASDNQGTVKVAKEVDLNGLTAWPNIPELKDVSGVGTYTANVELSRSWTGGTRAYLDLGNVFDTLRVSVNGQQLPPVDQTAQTTHVIDVGGYLKPGSNTIKVEVATTLNNRLRVANPPVFGGQPAQPYGLIGPARLVPYGEAPAYAETSGSGGVGGTVPTTLSLALGAPATFGAFTPGVDRSYDAATTATVTSTAGDALLSVDGGRLSNGAFTLSEPVAVTFSKSAWPAPVSNDSVTVGFKQHISATEPLRTGAYSKTLTFTLSTTTP